jgi:homoserine O-acetyltransferase/O-succinyltransferase
VTATVREYDVAIGALALDCGTTLADVVQRVTVHGELAADGENAVLVTHALTGSSRAAEWWPGIVGAGKLLDPERYAVVGVNALGSCYGSTGPASPDPDGRTYGAAFPVVSVADIVRAQAAALENIGIRRLRAVIGGSLGGMQALQWACDHPARVGSVVVIGAYDHFSPMGIALNAVAREAIRNTPEPRGIELARKIAMLSYKSETLFERRFGRKPDRAGGDPYARAADRFDVEGYLDHQGALFSSRMDAGAYLTLTRAMDLFDVRNCPVAAPFPELTFVGIGNDWLFSPRLVRAAAERFARAGASSTYLELASDHGHDAFLAEPDALAALLAPRFGDGPRAEPP